MTAEGLAAIVARYATPDPASLALLPKPTARENQKGRCHECGGFHGLPAIHIPYQGHAEITKSLIEVDPEWSWEPMAWVDGEPAIKVKGKRLVMWGRLTVLGKTMPGVGTCDDNKAEPEKELIGDFLRNAAMRFGFAVNLWSKADSADPAGSSGAGGYEPQRSAPTPPPSAPPVALDDPDRLAAVAVYNAVAALTMDQRTALDTWRQDKPAKLSVPVLTDHPEWCAEVSVFLRELGAMP